MYDSKLSGWATAYAVHAGLNSKNHNDAEITIFLAVYRCRTFNSRFCNSITLHMSFICKKVLHCIWQKNKDKKRFFYLFYSLSKYFFGNCLTHHPNKIRILRLRCKNKLENSKKKKKDRGGSNLDFSNPNRIESSENFLKPNRTQNFPTRTKPNIWPTI